ncbi:solute carrier family 35 member F5-like isoform X3 [Acropora muricata]|uniref:solute carrier family 35 member F5-like isoform X3 n=1 Tax=Acropora muricata TaxID=159855 RepID=UPI0034E5DD2F
MEASTSTNCCDRLCSWFYSLWQGAVRFAESNEEVIRKRRRLALGVVVLLIVDVLWVGSAELSDYIYNNEKYDKPFFTSYMKTSVFMIYLVGFLFYEQWRVQCTCGQGGEVSSDQAWVSEPIQTEETSPLMQSPSSTEKTSLISSQFMNESIYEELPDGERTSQHSASTDLSNSIDSKERHVTFSGVREIRQLSEYQAEQARLARIGYQANEVQDMLPIKQVAKVALIFCLLWFLATCSYQEALSQTTPAAVNLLSCASGLFTLILASFFQSSSADKFTLSKLLAVLASVAGIVLVTLSDSKSKPSGISFGALWALGGAFLYSSYLTMVKHMVPDERQMSLPMFFGFVGAFNCLLLWPVILFLHHLQWEVFELPPRLSVWGYVLLNGLIGTVLSDLLWLWGCYLTSSLTATLCLGLVSPLTMIVDVFMRGTQFSWMFYVGAIPMFLSFFAVSILSHHGDWDPVLMMLKKLVGSEQQLIERTQSRTR